MELLHQIEIEIRPVVLPVVMNGKGIVTIGADHLALVLAQLDLGGCPGDP